MIKTENGSHEWFLDEEKKFTVCRMGDNTWIPFEIDDNGILRDTGAGPFKTRKACKIWFANLNSN